MIPCGPVLSPQQALDHPQTAALGILQPLDFPGLPKPAPVAMVPISMSSLSTVPRRPAPVLGADTEAILGELGYDAAEIARLRASGAI